MRILRALRAGRREEGAAAVEFALMAPLLAFTVMTAVSVVSLVIDYTQLTQVSGAGARYATAAHMDPENPTVYQFRPTATAVQNYVRGISNVSLDSVTVTPDPASSFPGTQVTVTVTHHVSLGPFAAVANALASVVRASPPFPGGGLTLHSTAVQREE